MSRRNPEVDAFMEKAGKWQKEFRKLRTICLAAGLTEEVKWRLPCYSYQGGNVVIIQGFRDYCALLFFKGALLKDPERMLKSPGQTQAGRQARFTSAREIAERQSILKAYIAEAIGVQKAGLKVKLKKTADFAVPEEFRKALAASAALKKAFAALTPGRQRAYLFYFASAKQSGTRESRIAKYRQRILDGKGLNDE